MYDIHDILMYISYIQYKFNLCLYDKKNSYFAPRVKDLLEIHFVKVISITIMYHTVYHNCSTCQMWADLGHCHLVGAISTT